MPRVILKLTGELFGNEGRGVSFPAYDRIAKQLIRLKHESNLELALVLGGGNIFRGRELGDLEVNPVPADYMGMLATVINALGLQEALERNGEETRVQSAIEMRPVAEPFVYRKAMNDLHKGRTVIFAAGLGRPHFTTDSAAAQVASEIGADYLLKASSVDGVYDKDPKKYPDAVKFDRISYQEALVRDLGIMDATAFAMCRRQKVPIIIFSVQDLDRIGEVFQGKPLGTLISD